MSELPDMGTVEYDRLAARFDAKVLRSEDCWVWQAARTPGGYGRFGVGAKASRLAHHIAYYLTTGTDPAGRVVMHKCDNPSCVRPSHLRLGTHTTNSADKVGKRRHAGTAHTGALHGAARFTDEGAEAVRTLLAAGFSVASLTRIFGCSEAPILSIKNGIRRPSGTINWKATA